MYQELHNAPQTISDAITVTNAIGYRYLWIDRYCIAPDKKDYLMQRMGSIYSSSILTIIAAAGDGPNHGLPGVSSNRQNTHSPLSIGPWTIHPESLNVRQAVQKSKWNSRGW
jgi:hypothetical protein